MDPLRTVRLGILGDVHTQFDERDVELLDAAGYDAILFVGDLASLRPGSDVETAERIGRLRTPTFLHPGNHDAVTPPQLLAEVAGSDTLSRWFGLRQSERVARIREAIAPHSLTGYSWHAIIPSQLVLVAGRPHSFGGGRLACRAYLEEAFGIDSMATSSARIAQLIAETAPCEVIVLGHNGPMGLGSRPEDLWGCDFRPELGDFGDPDLTLGLKGAQGRVRAVVAGHMHHRLKGTKTIRRWAHEDAGCLYVNAACVPRFRGKGQKRLRHHVVLTLTSNEVLAEQVWLDAEGDVVERSDQARARRFA